MNKKLALFLPFSLTGFILFADQLTKWLVVKYLPIPRGGAFSPSVNVLGDFLRWTHVRNTAIVFGLGGGLPDQVKTVLFVLAPLVLLAVLLTFYFRARITPGFRWVLAAILGGGLGNMLDRIFRPAGVVDFIDVKFYGLFGLSRWPTFNIADSSIVIAAIVMLIMLILEEVAAKKKQKEKVNEQKN